MPAAGTAPSCVYAVLLAAGTSRRFGAANKLLAEIEGTPLVRRVAQRLGASRAAGLVVVTGFEEDKVRAALDGLEVEFAPNPDYTEGLASSLRRGIAQVPEAATGAMIALADMPGLTTAFADRLIAAFEAEGGGKIAYPARADGTQGNPVIWPRAFLPELQALTGDAGAKRLIGVHGGRTLAVPAEDEASFADIDTPADHETWRGG